MDTTEPKGIAQMVQTVVAEHLPQWFIAIFALIYLSGYLADFFYYSSLGISEAGSDALKLRHVQSGLFFFLIFACIGGVAYLAANARRNPDARTFLGRNKMTYWDAIVFQSSVVLAVAFVPPSEFREWWARLAFGALIFFNVIVYLWFIRRAEKRRQTSTPQQRPDTGEQLSCSPLQQQQEEAIDLFARWMIVVTVFCDLVIFGPPVMGFADRFVSDVPGSVESVLGPVLFLIFSIAFFQTLGRLAERISGLTDRREHVEYAVAMGFMLLGTLYLSLSAYAYAIMPYIPSSRGGANFCDAPLVMIHPKTLDGAAHANPPADSFGVVVYTSADTIYLADARSRQDACWWKSRPGFPNIEGFPKTDVIMRIIAENRAQQQNAPYTIPAPIGSNTVRAGRSDKKVDSRRPSQ